MVKRTYAGTPLLRQSSIRLKAIGFNNSFTRSAISMVDVWLPYDKTEICARIPTRSFLGIIKPEEKPGVPDARAEILRALNEPIGSKPLSEIVNSSNKVAIVVDDVTRPAPSHLIVPPLLEELNRLGVKDEDVTIIFGCGTHRAVKPDEARELLGEDVVNRVKTISHDCHAEDHVYMGTTKKYGTKVFVNKIFAEADVRILTGDIEMHYYAGFGGGRKSVLPGVSGTKTIQHNHAMILNPKARTGILEGNPIHEDMVEAARLAKADFILNVVTNSKGEIVQTFAGDLEQAFYKGVKLVEEMCKVSIDRRADIVIVSPGGHPADIDLYQAYKAVDNALDSVKHGGVIVLVAECPESYGNEVFYEWMMKFKDSKSMEKEIKKHFAIGGHKAYYLLKALQKAQIIIVTTMPDYYAVNVFKLRTARALNDALDEALKIVGKKAKVWAIPNGHITFPLVRT
ncbi:MAG: nickel-dependent lactate racemase [Candidatus Bathyarchaeota archaeon]|nr:nickel-dependent lactate racemase [Candidatus Bathyarchaeota archaeon]MDH5495195.1 nickel-dependent lactate racemase [Candidatus Bathyarchaeota archaeon]